MHCLDVKCAQQLHVVGKGYVAVRFSLHKLLGANRADEAWCWLCLGWKLPDHLFVCPQLTCFCMHAATV